MRPLITLTTDFGLEDPFVGIMKGVILSRTPNAHLIDLTHQIEPQNVVQAAQVLHAAYSYFPKKTVHLVVVDPGVGGARRPLAVKTRNYAFVAPDNGLLTPVLEPSCRVYELTQSRYFLPTVSSTFHGRDIFAPVAAWLAQGTPINRLGRKIQDPQTLDFPQAHVQDDRITGEVIYIDRFGNLFTNISHHLLHTFFHPPATPRIRIGHKTVRNWVRNYSDCKKGDTGALINSWGQLEIFRREGHAARHLKCGLGTPLQVTRTKRKP